MPNLVKICPMVLEKRFLDFAFFLLFRNYLPFEKGVTLHLNKCASLHQRILEKSQKCEKFTIGQTDRRRTTGDQKNSLERSAQVS